ncbi:MAG: XrtA/PEP-CTERM system histidine kinase PrsK [Pseudomonadota bacterium]
MYISTISYAAAAAAFLFLFALLLTSWRGRPQGGVLALACLLSALWGGAIAYYSDPAQPAGILAEVMEILRDAGWLAFLIMLLGSGGQAPDFDSHRLKRAAAGLAAVCFSLLAATVYLRFGAAGSVPAEEFTGGFFGRVILAVAGMALVEQLYRNVQPQQRWGIKFLCLGLGGMFAYDFYLYADALLFKRVDAAIWAARGITNALIVPLIAVSAARNPKWSLDISVSRRLLFHSGALLGAGVYLLVMAAAGYYIRYFGGNWGGVLQATFLFGALILLLVMLFSGTLRARVRVFLSKHFFSYKYDYRDEWLHFTRMLSEGEPGARLHERSIQAIAGLVDSPEGALWLAREAGDFACVANWNMPAVAGTEACDSQLCRFLAGREWVISLEEYESQPEMYPELELPDWLRAIPRAWLVVPLILHERLLGFVVLAQSRGKLKLDWEVSDLLKTAGRQAASYLAQLEAAQALLVARQFESFNRMAAFVVHDLKNLVAQLSLMLANAEKHKHNPAFQEDMLSTVEHSIAKMKRLLLQLHSGGQPVERPTPLALDDLLRRAVAAKSGFSPVPEMEAGVLGVSVSANPERLERVIGHLIQNAVEATPADGRVAVRLKHGGKSAIIEISDTGRGMSAQFIRERLFKPFESTKTTGMGIGTYESREYVRELGGEIEVESREGHGTVFRVALPLVERGEPPQGEKG